MIDFFERAFYLLLCHQLGDFVLQNDFISRAKAERSARGLYHLCVHAILYGAPFLLVSGFTWHIALVVLSHFVIDWAKTRGYIKYWQDQLLHHMTLAIFFV